MVQICSPQPSSPREAADWRWSRGGSSGSDETSSGNPARFLSSPHPFGETVVWRFLPARFRFGCVVIGSAQAIQISSSEVVRQPPNGTSLGESQVVRQLPNGVGRKP
nr:hypothetical protein Iba_chr01bCG4650 [Ipomoea batatas]